MKREGWLAAGVGALFALGLGISGMTDPHNVVGFLDVAGGTWNPALMLVMVGALLVHAPLVAIARGRPRPWRAGRFHWPRDKAVDARLIGGAAIFGVGWGLSGFCPGPAIVGVGSLSPHTLVFVAMLAVGAMIGRSLSRR